MVVERVAHFGCRSGKNGISRSGEFLNHPKGFLHAAGIGLHDGDAVGAGVLGRMAQPCRAVSGRGSGLSVSIVMQLAELLPPVLEGHDKVVTIEAEPTPVFDHAQPLTGSIEVGIDQPCHTGISAGGDRHRFHGTLGRISCLTRRWRTADLTAQCTCWCGESSCSEESVFSSSGVWPTPTQPEL